MDPDANRRTMAAFLSSFQDEVSSPIGHEEGIFAEIRRMHEEGADAWPGVNVPQDQFARFVGKVIRGHTADVVQGLSKLHAADLYLVCGCERRIPQAIRAFDEAYLSGIDKFVRVVRSEANFIDEVRQSLRHKLFLNDGPKAAKIGSYSGRGALKSWIGVVAQRTALSLLRGPERNDGSPIDDRVEAIAAVSDPELSYLRARYRREFQGAFREAIAILSDRERLILRLSVVDGLALERIAMMYQVSQSTVSRWVASAKQSVCDEVHRLLADRLSLRPEEFLSMIRLMQSGLESSVSFSL